MKLIIRVLIQLRINAAPSRGPDTLHPRTVCATLLLSCYAQPFLGRPCEVPLPLYNFYGLSEVSQKAIIEFCSAVSLSEPALRELSENITAVAL